MHLMFIGLRVAGESLFRCLVDESQGHPTHVSVPKEDHDHDERDHASLSLTFPPPNNIPPNAPSKRHRPIMIGALIAITVCLGMAIVILHDIPSVPKSSPPQMHFSCGSTAVEARTAGCQFDLTTFTWVPPACFDEPLMEDFLASRNWTRRASSR
ncbi:hypothetical protein BDV24DRAFT_157298 [Aspergillus arachidicola]|uniref:Uncharacterized protein n=1 Tax=Aspergillus arachidicola TaxID=656916 RepID=A0A5N6YVZ8_9EURO|nr:hypothetical protein BDV24DRAFT_157298 [Aspergillus arachidicola]